jgi:arsenate reductase
MSPAGAGAESWRADVERLRAAAPGHILFLCVANSARSQMAEGLARSLAPAGVVVSSAGSDPSRVNPYAVLALAEMGLDISGHRSKGTEEIAASVERGSLPPVDAVITLCAEEVCPVWLDDAVRAHWPHPDPAAADGTEAEVLDSFRAVRDALRSKLGALLGPDASTVAETRKG